LRRLEEGRARETYLGSACRDRNRLRVPLPEHRLHAAVDDIPTSAAVVEGEIVRAYAEETAVADADARGRESHEAVIAEAHTRHAAMRVDRLESYRQEIGTAEELRCKAVRRPAIELARGAEGAELAVAQDGDTVRERQGL